MLWGRCYEDKGVPPYWPWIEIIRAYIDTRDTDELHRVLGAGAGDIAEIVPQLREKLPSLPVSVKLEPAEAKFRLCDSIMTFIKRAANNNPLVIILDNMHCSDQSSLRILEVLAQSTDNTPLLVVGNCRNVGLPFNHPVIETQGELSRNPRFSRIKAGALSEDEVAQFVGGFIDGEIAPELIKAVHMRTDGNPLFVQEIIRLFLQEPQLLEESSFDSDQWSEKIPEAIRVVVSKRLNRISESCKRVLITAAILGPEVGKCELEHISNEYSADEVSGAVDEALLAGLIEEVEKKPWSRIGLMQCHQ